MSFAKILIANRGEIAIRIARACAALGTQTVAVYSTDDAHALHVRMADEAHALPAAGARAYLDIAALVALARRTGCQAVHPGYGFLSESAEFARACAAAGLVFIGPNPQALEALGDKTRARALAVRAGVPVLPGTGAGSTLADAQGFMASLGAGGAVMIKAVHGGGGRGMRVVRDAAALDAAWAQAQAEALAAFGSGELYAERLITRARHIEVQIVGDAKGGVVSLGERDCSVQRRHQKLIEIAPAPGLSPALRQRLAEAAVALGRAAGYDNVGTVEFLVDIDRLDAGALADSFVFIEANPRLQVEHTITEEVMGVDLVQTQLRLAAGADLSALGLLAAREPAGYAIQVRINAEAVGADGSTHAATGTLTAYEPASGPGVRVDGCGYVGLRVTASFDSLLAKVIACSSATDFAGAARHADRALSETRIEGVATNVGLLRAVLNQPDFAAGRLHTGFLDAHAAALAAFTPKRPHHFAGQADVPGGNTRRAGAAVAAVADAPAGTVPVLAPMPGMLAELSVQSGERVRAGQQVALLEAMKMQHVIEAPRGGVVRAVAVMQGDVLDGGEALLFIEPGADEAVSNETAQACVDLDHVRADLADTLARNAALLDAARPDAVAKRHGIGRRTTRENLDDLFDAGSFVEYGGLAVAAQRQRYPLQELMRVSPADGIVTGAGTVNGALFDASRTQVMGLAYDYTVMAGTQGVFNHKKTDRVLQVVHDQRLPLVLFAEGGGGRPGDTDVAGSSWLDVPSFANFASLSGLVPRVGVASGRCFAGNAVFFGCCDVTIATADANIGLGGPAMIEGGGLGRFAAEEIGPSDVQARNGVIDVLVQDDAQAVFEAKRVLGYFQGALAEHACADQRLLRQLIPENRLRAYDVRRVIETLADTGSVLELRRHFGPGMVTAFVRIDGRPMGLIANNIAHLGGAIDADGADKAARFMQLCDAFGLPILSLCDTPGFMVGPDSEKTAAVRHGARLFTAGASLAVPIFTVALRKGYGLGAMAMAGGGFHSSAFTVAWPTGEFGGMGFEGAVRLGMRKQLEAIPDPQAREQAFQTAVDMLYERGKAVSVAQYVEIDAVIDPAQTRQWLSRGLAMALSHDHRTAGRRRFVDNW